MKNVIWTKKSLTLIMTGLLTASILACVSEEDADDLLDHDPYQRPPEARDIISDEQLKSFEDLGLPIYGGDSPPDISGTYLFGDWLVEHNTSEYWPGGSGGWCHDQYTYRPAGPANVYNTTLTSPNCDLTAQGLNHYISGTGRCFTLYNKNSASFNGCDYTSINILSACLNDNGDFASPMTVDLTSSMENTSTCESLVSRGLLKAAGEFSSQRFEDDIAKRISD